MTERPTLTDETTPIEKSLEAENKLKKEGLPTKADGADLVSNQSRLHTKEPLIGIFACIYVLFVGWLAIQSFSYLSFSKSVLPYLIALAGLIVFYVRQRFRLLYGLLEVAFGIIICLGELPGIGAPLVGNLVSIIAGISLAKQVAGLYVIVRGLDNVGKAIKKYPDKGLGQSKATWRMRFRRKWEQWFGFD